VDTIRGKNRSCRECSSKRVLDSINNILI